MTHIFFTIRALKAYTQTHRHSTAHKFIEWQQWLYVAQQRVGMSQASGWTVGIKPAAGRTSHRHTPRRFAFFNSAQAVMHFNCSFIFFIRQQLTCSKILNKNSFYYYAAHKVCICACQHCCLMKIGCDLICGGHLGGCQEGCEQKILKRISYLSKNGI